MKHRLHREFSLETAGYIEKDCRVIGIQMLKRRACQKRIKLRNLAKSERRPYNQLAQIKDQKTVSHLDVRIEKCMKSIARRLVADRDELRPSEFYSARSIANG